FKLGWRSVVDLAEAVPEELAAVPGLGGSEAARRIIDGARGWLDEGRRRQADGAREGRRPAKPSRDGKLLEIRGVDREVLAKLKEAGVLSVEQLAHVDSAERLNEKLEGKAEAAKLIHWAKVYLGELPAHAPEP